MRSVLTLAAFCLPALAIAQPRAVHVPEVRPPARAAQPLALKADQTFKQNLAEALKRAGIETSAQLAKASPAVVREAIAQVMVVDGRAPQRRAQRLAALRADAPARLADALIKGAGGSPSAGDLGKSIGDILSDAAKEAAKKAARKKEGIPTVWSGDDMLLL